MKMPDATVVEAGRSILDVGVIGAVCIFLMAALAWTVKQWMNERIGHMATKDARLEDAKEFAAVGETMRAAMQANTVAMQAITESNKTVLDMLKDRRK